MLLQLTSKWVNQKGFISRQTMFLKNFFVWHCPSIVSKRYLWKSESFTVSIHWYFVFSWTLSRDNVVKYLIVACAFWGPKHFQSFQSTSYKRPYKSIIMIAQTSFKPVNQLADSWELSSNILTDGRVIAKKRKKTDLSMNAQLVTLCTEEIYTFVPSLVTLTGWITVTGAK